MRWAYPSREVFKCNNDGFNRDHLTLSSKALCVGDSSGDLIYANTESVQEAKVRAFKEGLHFCVQNNLFPLVMKTDSLIMKNIIDET